jgi:hypothetical protein
MLLLRQLCFRCARFLASLPFTLGSVLSIESVCHVLPPPTVRRVTEINGLPKFKKLGGARNHVYVKTNAAKVMHARNLTEHFPFGMASLLRVC